MITARVLSHVRTRLVRGLLVVLPLLITVWLLRILFDVVNENVTPSVRAVFDWAGMPGLERWFARLGIPVLGLVLTALTIYLIGLLAGNLAGRRLVAMVESFILRIPLIKGIYGASRQLLDAFSLTGTRAFSRVVMVQYPRDGLWTLGFVTSDAVHGIEAPGEDEVVSFVPVFLPTTPNPTSGWMVLVPTESLRVLDISVEQGLKLIVSGGLVGPSDLGPLVRAWSATQEHPRTG